MAPGKRSGPTRSAGLAGDQRGLTTEAGRLIGRGCMTSPIPHRSQPVLRSGRSPRQGQRPWPTRGDHINNRLNCRRVGTRSRVDGDKRIVRSKLSPRLASDVEWRAGGRVGRSDRSAGRPPRVAGSAMNPKARDPGITAPTPFLAELRRDNRFLPEAGWRIRQRAGCPQTRLAWRSPGSAISGSACDQPSRSRTTS